MYDSFTRVLPHASASLKVEGRPMRIKQTCISVKPNPDGISNNMLMTSSPAHSPERFNLPPNFPFTIVPIPGNSLLSSATRDPDNNKSSKFGNCAIISRTCTRVTTPVSMVKEVADWGNLQSEVLRNSGTPPCPNNDIFSTFVNHGVYLKNFSGTQPSPPIQTRRSLTW